MRSGILGTETTGARRTRSGWAAGAAIFLLGAIALPGPARAQYFGQNKVQYKNFHWEVLRTEHFDVHYYRGEEEAVQDAAVMAERGYRRLSRVLDHQIKAKIPLVLYASHTDFEQTNITPELIGVGTGRASVCSKSGMRALRERRRQGRVLPDARVRLGCRLGALIT